MFQVSNFFVKNANSKIKYGLNDIKRIKKKQVALILYSFTPSELNFQAILMPKVILAKILSQKSGQVETFLS